MGDRSKSENRQAYNDAEKLYAAENALKVALDRIEAMKTQLFELDSKVGLHQDITIIYVVDGYQATFNTNDGDLTVVKAHGETIQEALVALNEKMKGFDKVTKYQFKEKNNESPKES